MMKILLTLDYELYNGLNSGSVKNCLVKPMEELLKVTDKYTMKFTLFVDVVFINRLHELSSEHTELEEEYNQVVSNLKELAVKGHDLQLHIHPNWLKAIYSDGVWTSNLKDYKISDMLESEVQKMFSEGIKLLEGISGKKPIAYRAGAYCIQTYPNITQLFKEYGLQLDSSVFRNRKSITNSREWYDYTRIPNKYSYRFEDDVTREVRDGSFIELSIPSHKYSFLKTRICKREFRNSGDKRKPWGDGTISVGGVLDSKNKQLFKKLFVPLKKKYLAASIDNENVLLLNDILEKESYKKREYMLIMGHPKCFSPFTIEKFDQFLLSLKDEDRFFTVSEILESL